jgi:putative transposase
MDRVVFGVMTLAMQWLNPRFNARMQFLEAQIRMLRSRVDASRIVPTPRERTELLRFGAAMDHEIEVLMHVVVPETYKKWLRQKRGGHTPKVSGRPRTPFATRALILRLARENFQWGFRRIVGELKKLGIRISTTTIRNVLKEEGHFPEPHKAVKKPPIPWTTFVHANMESMVSCDFFTKRIFTLRGVRDAYVLVFIHLGTRKVYSSSSTYHPDTAWVIQQARNASMWMEDEGISPRYLIRDHDRKYPDEFDAFWKDSKVRPIKIPPRPPMVNAFVETYIGKMKQEMLNHFMCFGLDQLDYINRMWLKYYLEQRPHRGVGRDNTVLDANFIPQSEGAVRCKKELGGILKIYYRDAA